MAYKNKTYVCFDADTDILYYRLMTAWKENNHTSFNFHNAHDINSIWNRSNEETIKRRLRERLANTKVLVLLIGENTKNLYRYVRWEIDYAIKNSTPIIGVNLNKKKHQDNLCPPLLKNELAIYIPYGQKILDFALNNWPDSHYGYKKEGKSGPYYYEDSVYEKL